MKDLHAVSFLNLDKEAKINLTKIGINELYICHIAKTNLFGLVNIIIFIFILCVIFSKIFENYVSRKFVDISMFQESSLNLFFTVFKRS